jgi:hypothetical protein
MLVVSLALWKRFEINLVVNLKKKPLVVPKIHEIDVLAQKPFPNGLVK